MYGGTKHTADSCKFTSNEYSVIATANYSVAINRVRISSGLATLLTAIHTPDYNKKDSNNKNHQATANTKKYVAVSPFIVAIISHKLSINTHMNAELRAGYLYLKGINNKDEIELITSFTSGTSATIIPQEATIQHKIYIKAKINIAVHSLFYGATLNWHHDKNNNAFGGMLVAGYNF
jgi:hypothetical protein